MLKPSEHPEVAILSDYASGRLEDHRCKQIDHHLADCEVCCDLLDQIGSGHVEALMQELQHETTFPSFETDAATAATCALDDIPCGESRYELQSEIGAGGMGVVFEAWDRQLKRPVAVKTLKPGSATRGLPDRFVREALITGRLDHPGVPAAHELGTLADGRPFMALRLVRGRNLAALLAEHRAAAAAGAADTGALLSTFGRLCDCVAYAHAQGIIHRDVKPANVMVGEFGEVQLMDWGLARRVEEPAPTTVATSTVAAAPGDETPVAADLAGQISATVMQPTLNGTILGTLGYMAPEQARGEQHRTGPASDVFALGAVLCEILTGRPPFSGDDRERLVAATRAADFGDLRQRLTHGAADSALADETLTELMFECLQPEPARRPADAQAVASRFAAWQAGVAQRLDEARLAQARSETQIREERKRRRIQLALLIGSVIFAVTVWRLIDRNQQQQAQFVADERQRQSAETATARADLSSFATTLNKAIHSDQQDDPHWKEADFYLARAETAGRSLADTQLDQEIATAREQQHRALDQADADWALLAGMEQMASNSRVGPSGGSLQFVDGVGPDNEARPVAGRPVAGRQSAGRQLDGQSGGEPALPLRRPARNGTQRPGTLRAARNGRPAAAGSGLLNTRISMDRSHRAVSAFARYGLDVDLVTAAEAAREIQARPPAFRQALFPHLQIWFHYAVEGGDSVVPWVQELLDHLDDDSGRRSLRAAIAQRDVETLLIEATNPAFPQQPPELVWSVASLIRHRAPRVSSDLLSLAHLNHLDSTIIMWDLSRDMQMSGRRSEALMLLLSRAALESDPVQRAKALINIGHHYQRTGDIRKLVMVLRQAIELDPGQFTEGSFVRDLGQIGNTPFEVQTLTQMLEAGSLRDPQTWLRLGDLHLDEQRWHQARDAFVQARQACADHLTDAPLADLPSGVTDGPVPQAAPATDSASDLAAEIAERIALCDLMLDVD